MKKALQYICLFLLSLTPSLFAQDTEVLLRPSESVRIPELNPDQTYDLSSTNSTRDETGTLPRVESWSSRLSQGWWYINLGRYETATVARETGQNLKTALGTQGGRSPALAFTGGNLYIGPLKPGEIFTFVNLVKRLGWKSVELYRP